MKQPDQPLAEVFGHLVSDQSASANRYRSRRLCPFNNKVPNCTKDKAKNPLGVCSVLQDGAPAITCPIRYREDWLIADEAASFFFPDDVKWSSLIEVRLNDANENRLGISTLCLFLTIMTEEYSILEHLRFKQSIFRAMSGPLSNTI